MRCSFSPLRLVRDRLLHRLAPRRADEVDEPREVSTAKTARPAQRSRAPRRDRGEIPDRDQEKSIGLRLAPERVDHRLRHRSVPAARMRGLGLRITSMTGQPNALPPSQDVHRRVDHDPHDVDEVPVDPRNLDAAVMLGREVAPESADGHERQQGQADEDVRSVQAREPVEDRAEAPIVRREADPRVLARLGEEEAGRAPASARSRPAGRRGCRA